MGKGNNESEDAFVLPAGLREKAAKALTEALEGDGEIAAAIRGPEEKHYREMLFMRATVAYMIDPIGRPPDAFYPMMEGTIQLDSFRSRVYGAKWTASRERMRAQARSDLIRKLGRQVVSDQMKEVQQFQQLQGWLYDLCTPRQETNGDVERDADGMPMFHLMPRSLEGAIKCLKEITILLNNYRATVLSAIEPQDPGVIEAGGEVQGPFSEQELGDMAEKLLEQRMLTRQTSREDDA